MNVSGFKYKAKPLSKKQLRKQKKDETLQEVSSEDTDLELRKIRELLPSGWCTVEVPFDGNCLFHALANQLELNGKKKLSHIELREKLANHISNKKDYFEHFLNDQTVEDYVFQMSQASVYGGEMEIAAFCQAFQCSVTVWTITGEINYGSEYPGTADEPGVNIVFLKKQYSDPHYMSVGYIA